jgi:predicted DNA-binding WGR domain protein
MTGTLSVSRAEMEKYIIANGGDIAKTVTNSCTHLISAQTGTKKCQDAEKKGAIVVNEDWVREQCGDGGDMEVDEEEEEAPAPVAKKATKASAKQAKKEVPSSNSSDSIYLECPSNSGGKFWQCNLDGSCTTVTYGKVGSAGSTQEKDHGTEDAARKFFDKMVKEKTKKGYEEVENDAPDLTVKGGKDNIVSGLVVEGGKAKVSQASSSGNTETIHLECPSSSGGKFWECTLDGTGTTVTYGKVGAAGSTQVKDHGSEEAARKFFDKMVKEKSKKGYS